MTDLVNEYRIGRGRLCHRLPPEVERVVAAGGELLDEAGIRRETIGAAFECADVMPWRWTRGRESPSLRPGTAGHRYYRMLRSLAARHDRERLVADELAAMDDEGHGERWANYDAGWVWRFTPEGPRVARSARRGRAGVLLRDRVPRARRSVDPAGQRVAPGAH